MLQNIHEHIKGWVAGIVLAVLTISFLLWGVESYLTSGGGGGKYAAKVDGHKISNRELQVAFQQMQRGASERGIPLTQAMNNQLKAMALQNLVVEAALTNAASKAGFQISLQQAQQMLALMPTFQVNGKFSQQRFQQFLYANDMTVAQFLQFFRNRLLVSQMQSGIQMSAFVLPKEAADYYNWLYQERNFAYLTVPSKKFLAEIKVSEQQIADYYKRHQAEFRVPAKISINYLLVSPKTLSTGIHPSTAELKQFYQDHLSNYRVPQQWKVAKILINLPTNASLDQVKAANEKMQKIRQQIINGKKFNDFMQQYNGSLQTLRAGDLSKELSKVLTKLKPQQISQPYRDIRGINLLQLIAIEPAKTKTFAEVEGQIKQVIVHQKVQTELTKINDKLSDLTYTNPESLQPAADELKLKVLTSDFFSNQGTKSGITANPKVIAAAYNDDVLQQGNNSNVLVLDDGSLVVLRLHKRQASYVPPLKTLAADIKQKITAQMAETKAALLANKIQTEISQGASGEAIAKRYQLAWTTEKDIKRNDKKISAPIMNTAFNRLTQQDKVATTALTGGDTAVVELLQVTPANYQKASKEQKSAIQENLIGNMGQNDYQLYVEGVRKAAKIKIFKQK